MKKSLLFFVVIFSSFALSVSAENILTLTNPKTQETNVFRKGSYLVFELNADKSVREGFILEIQDSSLSFNDILFEGQVSLSEINILAGSTKGNIVAGRIADAVGNALIIAGTTVFDCGLDFIFYGDGNYYYWPIGGTIWLAGAVIAGIGYAFDWASSPFDHVVRVRNYRDWNASIIASPQPSPSGEGANQNIISPLQDSTQGTTPPSPEKSSKGKRKKRNISDDDVYGK